MRLLLALVPIFIVACEQAPMRPTTTTTKSENLGAKTEPKPTPQNPGIEPASPVQNPSPVAQIPTPAPMPAPVAQEPTPVPMPPAPEPAPMPKPCEVPESTANEVF